MASLLRYYIPYSAIYKKLVFFLISLFLSIGFSSCKNNDKPEPADEPTVTSAEYIDELLFVTGANFQILTSEPATFSSTDSKIQITSDGVIHWLTSAEVVPIDINWTNQGTTSRIYALGATDNNFQPPYASFHGEQATDPIDSYKKGWQTLRSLPNSNNYTIVLRHADASVGTDFSTTTGPPNWWKSCESTQARQLNQQGISRATQLGSIFKDLNYPITRVYSSEFCRAIRTAELINAGPEIEIDNTLNHNSHNVSGYTQISGIILILERILIDDGMTLIVTHHPANEVNYPSFPLVSPFTWTGAYFVKTDAARTITYEGAVSWGMFKYWRDKKLNRL